MKATVVRFVCESFYHNQDRWRSCQDEDCDFYPLYHYKTGLWTVHIWVDRVSIRKEFEDVFNGRLADYTGELVLHSDYTQDQIYDAAQDLKLRYEILTAPYFYRVLDQPEKPVAERRR